jgi:hypothetical protein
MEKMYFSVIKELYKDILSKPSHLTPLPKGEGK